MGAKSSDGVVVLVFLDTEFTDFVKPDLISIALVAEDGREFYAERTDYRHDDCNDFVRETVLPLLGRVHGAACSRSKLTKRLHGWFDLLPEPAIIVYDFETDWGLLADAMLGHTDSKPPANFGEPLHLENSSITHPVFERAQNYTYIQDWPPHHALADARALKAGYRAWCTDRAKISGVEL
jgi:3' exoribonuclease, RNase T-like